MRTRQAAGFVFALGGLVLLVVPSLSSPPPFGSGMMLAAGVAWGIYSLRGRHAGEPIRTTAENFLRAVPLAVVLSIAMAPRFSLDGLGCLYAIVSGALASGVGYAIWYTAVRGLRATQAAAVQLSVPVIAAGGGVALLGEQLGLRFVIASSAILGGIALVVVGKESFK
jgi:drug/metabolite transporter (DMT)-like permease